MKFSKTGRTFWAITMAFGLAVLLQFAGEAQTPGAAGATAATTPTAQERTAPEQVVTVIGCIQREEDFRRASDAGRGGVAGTGVGAGNEFVLANAMMSSASPSGAAGTTPGGTPPAAEASAKGNAFELTGANEGQAAQYVGKRVEISGRLKAAEVAPSGTPTGGATAGRPPEGIDVTGKDLKLREIEVTTIKEAAGSCPAK
jgi:hypothetical protein